MNVHQPCHTWLPTWSPGNFPISIVRETSMTAAHVMCIHGLDTKTTAEIRYLIGCQAKTICRYQHPLNAGILIIGFILCGAGSLPILHFRTPQLWWTEINFLKTRKFHVPIRTAVELGIGEYAFDFQSCLSPR